MHAHANATFSINPGPWESPPLGECAFGDRRAGLASLADEDDPIMMMVITGLPMDRDWLA